MSNFGRVRRDHDGRIGIRLWGDDEHLVTDEQAAALAAALMGVVNQKQHRGQADFGKPFTVYGSAGPYVATNPEDDGDGA